MLFKKKPHILPTPTLAEDTPPLAAEDNLPQTAEAPASTPPAEQLTKEETAVPAPDTDTRPIYIIGNTAVALFLAARLQDCGQKVILVSTPANNQDLSTNGILLKEDYSLKKNRYRFTTSFWLKESPKLVILCEPASTAKSAATLISPHKLESAPVLCFSMLKDNSWLRAFLGNNIIEAYFEGWTTAAPQQVAVLGRAPAIVLSQGTYNNATDLTKVQNILSRAGLSVKTEEDYATCFWRFFAVYAVGSLLAAALEQNIFDITKNKLNRERAKTLLAEICTLAATEKVSLDADSLLKTLYNIPNNYIFPLQQAKQSGELVHIGGIITETAHRGNCKIPELNRLLKQLYTQSLNAIA